MTRMRKTLCALAAVTVMLSLFGCGGKRYKVSCPEYYENVKASYKAGETVKVYDPYLMTDVSVYYYVDGESVNTVYDEQKGMCITFEMPDHDVKITTEVVNSMVHEP